MFIFNKQHCEKQKEFREHKRSRAPVIRMTALGMVIAMALTACGSGEPAPIRGQKPTPTLEPAAVSGDAVSASKPVMSEEQAQEEAERATAGMSLDEKVSRMVVGYMDIREALRYFPEESSTLASSGSVIPESQDSLMTVRSRVNEVYASRISNGAGKVMMGLTSYPKITAMITPSFMNYEVVTSLLRTELGFNGVVYTPPLNDNRLQKRYPHDADAYLAVEAVKAGCDVLYQPKDKDRTIQALRIAVNTGNMSEDRINVSVVRILKDELMHGVKI